MLRRFCVTFLIMLLSTVTLQALELTVPDWEIVADGVSVSKPVRTAFGFATVTDGRTLIGWTENGDKYFQRSLKRKPSELLCSDNAGFIWSVSYDRLYLSCFNPDGTLLWEKKLPAPCSTAELISGRDGRLFAALSNSVLCVGINGMTLWECPLGETAIKSLSEADDGSLIVNGTVIISPFGEVIETAESAYPHDKSGDSGIIHTATTDFITRTEVGTSSISAVDEDGNEIWKKSFYPVHVLYFEVTDNTIMTLGANWVISGYCYNSSPSHSQAAVIPSMIYESGYGTSASEKDYRSIVNGLNRIIQYDTSITLVNPSQRNVTNDLAIIKKAENAGIDLSELLARIILEENDPIILETAVHTAGCIGRDPYGLIFNALQTRLEKRTSFQFDSSMYAAIMDAYYAICLNSGTVSRIQKALMALSPLLSDSYQTLVREHAAETSEKLIRLLSFI